MYAVSLITPFCSVERERGCRSVGFPSVRSTTPMLYPSVVSVCMPFSFDDNHGSGHNNNQREKKK